MNEEGQRVSLVVDDENAIRRYLRAALSAEGFAIFEAASGQVGDQCSDLSSSRSGYP